MESPFEINENSEKRFMQGKINLIIRLYYYFQEGVNQLNSVRTLGYALIGIAGVFAVSKSEANYWGIIIAVGLISLPIFILVGYLWVKRGRKSTEYFALKYTSTYGKYGVELQEEQMRLLREIRDGIKKLNEKDSNNRQ